MLRNDCVSYPTVFLCDIGVVDASLCDGCGNGGGGGAGIV